MFLSESGTVLTAAKDRERARHTLGRYLGWCEMAYQDPCREKKEKKKTHKLQETGFNC